MTWTDPFKTAVVLIPLVQLAQIDSIDEFDGLRRIDKRETPPFQPDTFLRQQHNSPRIRPSWTQDTKTPKPCLTKLLGKRTG